MARPPIGECDACGKRHRVLTRFWEDGVETFACEECRGVPCDEMADLESERAGQNALSYDGEAYDEMVRDDMMGRS